MTTAAKLKEAEELIDRARNILYRLQDTTEVSGFNIGNSTANETIRRCRLALATVSADIASAGYAAREVLK